MPQGLQVFDENNNTIFDTNFSAGRVLGTVTLVAGTDGSVTDSNFSLGTPFWFAMPSGVSPPYNAYSPEFSFSSNQLSWTWPSSGLSYTDHEMVYGVY